MNVNSAHVIPFEFYQREVVEVARDLLCKVLVTTLSGRYSCGLITETEAYDQAEKACHAYNGRRTARTECLFHPGGRAYVYLCYGIHHLLNVTTGPEGEAAAVLIRAIQPLEGLDDMLERRGQRVVKPQLTAGPGRLTEALGVSVDHNNLILQPSNGIWIENPEQSPAVPNIISTPRIGVDYAGEDALLPWRFYLQDSQWVSKTPAPKR